MVLLAIAAAFSGTLHAVQSADQQTAAVVEQDSTAPAATDADSVPIPEPSAKARRYYHSGNVLWVAATLWGLAVPALLLFSGLSARLRN
jgi:hypothetical protein